MLDQIEEIFEDMKPMMKKLKKASYEKNTEDFLDRHGHYFEEMRLHVLASGDKEAALSEVAGSFTSKVRNHYEKKGKVPGYIQADLNFFMIYYVFPTLLKQEDCGKDLAESIRLAWGKEFPGNDIRYTDYDTLYGAFREKIFGIF